MPFSSHGKAPQITEITFSSSAEQSHIFDTDVKQFDISARGSKSFTFGYVTASTLKTVPQSGGYFEEDIKGPLTVFLAVPTASGGDTEVLEILEWQSED